MAQTIWIHKLSDEDKRAAEGMDYICEHMFQAMSLMGKLANTKGWNPMPEVTTKEGKSYRALVCDSCKKNYSHGHVRMAKEPVKEPALV